MRAAPNGIDWNRVVSLSRARGITAQLAEALEFLRKRFGADIPADTIDSLRASPASRADHRRYNLWMASRRGPISLLQRHWFKYSRGIGRVRMVERIIMIPQYVQAKCQTDRFWKILARLTVRGCRRVGYRRGRSSPALTAPRPGHCPSSPSRPTPAALPTAPAPDDRPASTCTRSPRRWSPRPPSTTSSRDRAFMAR